MTEPTPRGEADLRLRATRPGDLGFVLAAEACADNNEWILPWDDARHRAALEDPDSCHLVVESPDRRPLGFVILAGVRHPHGSVECRRMVITEKGQGHGHATMRAVMAFVFEDLGAHRLWLDTQVRNRRARHVYAAAGFIEEGVLRECWHQHGEWQSLVVMSVLETEYRHAQAG